MHHLPRRLYGSVEIGNSSDVNVLSVVNQYQTVAGVRAQPVRPNASSYGDEVAFEYF